MPITSTLVLSQGTRSQSTGLAYTLIPKTISTQIDFLSITVSSTASTPLSLYPSNIEAGADLIQFEEYLSSLFNLVTGDNFKVYEFDLNLFNPVRLGLTYLEQVQKEPDIISFIQEQVYPKDIKYLNFVTYNKRKTYFDTYLEQFEDETHHTVTGVQVDVHGPRIKNLSPVSGSSFNNPLTGIDFDLFDQEGSNVVLGSVFIDIDTIPIVATGVNVCPSWFGTASLVMSTPSKYHFSFTPSSPFSPDQPVLVSGRSIDSAVPANSGIFNYNFRVWNTGDLVATIEGLPDTEAPYLSNLNPFQNEIDVLTNKNIYLEISDLHTGLKTNSVYISLEDTLLISGGQNINTSVATVTQSAINFNKGMSYTIDPVMDLEFNKLIVVTVSATDLYQIPNVLNTSYSFTTIDNSHLIASGLKIEQNSIFMDMDTGVSYDLIVSGTKFKVSYINYLGSIDTTESFISYNGELVPGIVFTSVSGTSYYDVDFTLIPNYREDCDLVFHVSQLGAVSGITLYKEFTTRLLWGYNVCYTPEQSLPFQTNIPVTIRSNDFAYKSTESEHSYNITTIPMPKNDLYAEITARPAFNDDNLLGSLISNNPFFEYGKEMELEIECKDFAGNLLNYKWKFKIEERG